MFNRTYNRVEHRNKSVLTVFNNDQYEDLLKRVNFLEMEVGYVPAGYEQRPDLISNVFYGTPNYWWLLCQVNNIDDPHEGFDTNQRILIPKL